MMFGWFKKDVSDEWRGGYQYFTAGEMECKCGCGGLPKHSLMVKLVALRRLVGRLPISSGYRCEEYNTSIGGGPAHPAGVTADTLVYGWKALAVVICGYAVGFRGFGVHQKGIVSDRFIHLDILPHSIKHPRPTIWSY